MATLLARLSALQDHAGAEFVIEGWTPLTVSSTSAGRSGSHLKKHVSELRWLCSADVLELAVDLVEPLQRGAGHHLSGRVSRQFTLNVRNGWKADIARPSPPMQYSARWTKLKCE